VKEEEPKKKEEEKPVEPAKEPSASPVTSHKRKLTIVRANQANPDEPATEKAAEKTEVAATEYKPPLVHTQPSEPQPQPQPEPETQPQTQPESKTETQPAEPQPEPQPEVKPEPEKHSRKQSRQQRNKKAEKAAPAPAPAPAEAVVETPKEEKKPEPVKEEAPKVFLMPVDKEAFQSLYPNCNIAQMMQFHYKIMPYKYLQAMKGYLIPFGQNPFPPTPEETVYDPLNRKF